MTILIALAAASSGVPAAEFSLPDGWDIYADHAPAALFTDGDGLSALTSKFQIKAALGESTPRRYDVRSWLERYASVEFKGGSIAIYDAETNVLVVIAPRETVSFLDATFWGCRATPVLVRIEATLVAFECRASASVRNASYDRLRSLAGSSWRELEHFAVMTKSGQRMLATSVERNGKRVESKGNDESDSSSLELKEDDLGASFELEPVIAPNGSTIDLNFAFLRHSKNAGPLEELRTQTSLAMNAGTNAVATVWPQPRIGAERQRLYGLVLHAQLVNEKGENLRENFVNKVRYLKREREKAAAAESDSALPSPPVQSIDSGR